MHMKAVSERRALELRKGRLGRGWWWGLNRSPRRREHLASMALKATGARRREPQRVMNSKPRVERARAKVAWQACDRALHEVASMTGGERLAVMESPAIYVKVCLGLGVLALCLRGSGLGLGSFV